MIRSCCEPSSKSGSKSYIEPDAGGESVSARVCFSALRQVPRAFRRSLPAMVRPAVQGVPFTCSIHRKNNRCALCVTVERFRTASVGLASTTNRSHSCNVSPLFCSSGQSPLRRCRLEDARALTRMRAHRAELPPRSVLVRIPVLRGLARVAFRLPNRQQPQRLSWGEGTSLCRWPTASTRVRPATIFLCPSEVVSLTPIERTAAFG